MKKKELISKIDAWLRERREEYIKDVISAVNIPSISGKSEGIYPYGKDCAKMLDFMQEVMERYTLPYQNHEYHCASSLIKGKKRKQGDRTVLPYGRCAGCRGMGV